VPIWGWESTNSLTNSTFFTTLFLYTMLEILDGQMKEAGYVPDINFVLHDVEEEVKEHMLSTH
jgi:hypothetical protein